MLVSAGCIGALIGLVTSVVREIDTEPEAAIAIQAALHALANQFGSHGSLGAMACDVCLDALVHVSNCAQREVRALAYASNAPQACFHTGHRALPHSPRCP